MKRLYFFALLLLSTMSYSQSNYAGNNNDGFGGPVGKGSLSMSTNGAILTFVLTKGTNSFNDALVIYIDAKTGGFNSTSGFLNSTDGLRKAISGVDGTNRSTLNFPSGFEPDYAVALDKNYAGLWELQGGSTPHTFINSANLTPTGSATSATYTFAINTADLGFFDNVVFNFLGTYISPTAYRSNEAIGDAMVGFTNGYNTQNILTYNTYNSVLPVKLVGFKAIKESNVVKLNWTVAQESNIENYQVQRSKDGINFTTIQTIQARNQSGYQPNYSITDASPLKGINYYRLAINENGRKELSGVATVTMNQAVNNFTIYYTPGSTRINIKLIGLNAGNYSVSVVNAGGQVLQSMRLAHDGSEANKEINLKGGLSKGIYRVVLLNDNNRNSQAFMVP